MYEKIKYLEVIERMEAVIRKLNSMVVKGGATGTCSCRLNRARENGKELTVTNGKIVRPDDGAVLVGGAKSKRSKLESMKVAKLQKMAVSKGMKITKKKDGKTVYLKKATLVNKLLGK